MAKATRNTENKVNNLNAEFIDSKSIWNSKRYSKGVNSGFSFQSPAEILTPVLNLFRENNSTLVRLDGSHDINIRENDETEYTAYGRVLMIAEFNLSETMHYEVGIMYALDLGKPYIKIFRGPRVKACANLCIFSAEDTVRFDLYSGYNMEIITGYIQKVSDKILEVQRIYDAMNKVLISPEQCETLIGKMLLHTISHKTLNGITSITAASKYMADDKSRYYYKQQGFNAWHLFNSLTEDFGNVNFFDIPEKTRDVFEMLKNMTKGSQLSLEV